MTNQIITVDDTNPGLCSNAGVVVNDTSVAIYKNLFVDEEITITQDVNSSSITCEYLDAGDGNLTVPTIILSGGTSIATATVANHILTDRVTLTTSFNIPNNHQYMDSISASDSITTNHLTVSGTLTDPTADIVATKVRASNAITTDDFTVTGYFNASTADLSVSSLTASKNITTDHATIQSSFDAPSAKLSVASLTTTGDLTVNGTLHVPTAILSVGSVEASNEVETNNVTISGHIDASSASTSTISNISVVGTCNLHNNVNFNGPVVCASEVIFDHTTTNSDTICNGNVYVSHEFGRKVATYPENNEAISVDPDTYLHRLNSGPTQTIEQTKRVWIPDGREGQEMVFKNYGGVYDINIIPSVFFDGYSVILTNSEILRVIWSGTSWQMVLTTGSLQ